MAGGRRRQSGEEQREEKRRSLRTPAFGYGQENRRVAKERRAGFSGPALNRLEDEPEPQLHEALEVRLSRDVTVDSAEVG